MPVSFPVDLLSTMAVMNPPERKLAKRTSVHWVRTSLEKSYFFTSQKLTWAFGISIRPPTSPVKVVPGSKGMKSSGLLTQLSHVLNYTYPALELLNHTTYLIFYNGKTVVLLTI